jgi:hypothetical protein
MYESYNSVYTLSLITFNSFSLKKHLAVMEASMVAFLASLEDPSSQFSLSIENTGESGKKHLCKSSVNLGYL